MAYQIYYTRTPLLSLLKTENNEFWTNRTQTVWFEISTETKDMNKWVHDNNNLKYLHNNFY